MSGSAAGAVRLAIAALAVAAVMMAPAGAQRAPIADEVSTSGLSGTLLRPQAPERPPVVLLISGSGPTDRDGKNTGVTAVYMRRLAEGLAAQGIASLRYDKRGIGRSAAALTRESDVQIDHFVADAAAWLAFLRARVDLGRVVVAGHSEGGLIALLLARQAAAMDAVVLIATPGRPVGVILRDQLRAIETPQQLLNEAEASLAALERGETVTTVSPPLMPLLRPSVQPYLRSLLAIDPEREVGTLPLPLLVVSGGHDLQVGQADAAALARARPDAERLHIPAMNHVLAIAPPDRAGNLKLYADPNAALAPTLVETIAAFVQRIAG